MVMNKGQKSVRLEGNRIANEAAEVYRSHSGILHGLGRSVGRVTGRESAGTNVVASTAATEPISRF